MALPTPRDGENKQQYVSRCMETMSKKEVDRYPCREQRIAMCYASWEQFAKQKEEEVCVE